MFDGSTRTVSFKNGSILTRKDTGIYSIYARVETWLLGFRVSVSVSVCGNSDVKFQFGFGFAAVEK